MLALVIGAACGSSPRSVVPAPDPWARLTPAGAPIALWSYPEAIERYAPEDRGAYVVRVRGSAEERAAEAARFGATDDLVGADGYVVRLDAPALAALATRPPIASVAPLQPSDRRGLLADRATELPEVRIDLFADATTDEVAAVAAWVTWRGGQVLWQGPRALRARVPHEARDEAARLSVVRWIE
ncbi:MAG: hypothetical protein IPL61_40020 [Myxococcales bacterium]|nr:hypothetical protein [Myxococcales bacterium]